MSTARNSPSFILPNKGRRVLLPPDASHARPPRLHEVRANPAAGLLHAVQYRIRRCEKRVERARARRRGHVAEARADLDGMLADREERLKRADEASREHLGFLSMTDPPE